MTASGSHLSSMVELQGGTFRMGSDDAYPEEAPARQVSVGPFAIDRHPVIVADFERFVEATGYVTVAERPVTAEQYPDADPELLVPGSIVFTPTAGPVELTDSRQWWMYVPGADWRHPYGPGSDNSRRADHPVTHIAHEDAATYAEWAGKDLPTEAEWEFAARGGLESATFAWGNEERPDGQLRANFWQGEFPWRNTGAGGWRGTSPVCTFPANDFGLFDVTGNVWEWTSDYFSFAPSGEQGKSCCAPHNPRVDTPAEELAGASNAELAPRKVIKGGSHLCSPDYCFRYRPAARQAEAVDTSTSHIGFRCVRRS